MTLAVSIAQSGANNVTMRNRVINGAMMIDQRNNGASVSTPTNKQYCLDRWAFWFNGGGGSAAATVQQSSVAPAGFVNSIAITQAASYSPTSTNYNVFAQYIEGYNVADFGWGTANAQPVTLSFWVRSSLTGTFGGAISNSGQTRSYPFTYTINSANTFEFKTITHTLELLGHGQGQHILVQQALHKLQQQTGPPSTSQAYNWKRAQQPQLSSNACMVLS